MRVRRVIFCVLSVLASISTFGSSRITSVDGYEVAFRSGAREVRRNIAANAVRHVGANAIVNVTAGADTSAAVNDYRRIQDAINAAAPTDQIVLSGTFDFTAPFAAAAWALGNDNTASTADDYSVYVPAGLNNVTLTATSLGSATIQGPGDLASINLEGFLVFDGGDNQNWTISNLQIFDFDLGIGMFNGAGGADAFNNTVIQNNLIRVPADLNATAAPADVLQNIGLHYSFGTNQSIVNNTFELDGGGLSASPNTSAEVGMQSNTSGGAVYDGLTISGNVIHVRNAQAADPARILGIWENGHAHTSDILVQNNSFLNDAAGNDSALNGQRAFRVTSHSSATTTVTYDQNTINEANIGFEWITGSNFTGNTAVILSNDTVTACGTGVLVQSNGIANLSHDVITGSGAGGGVRVVTGSLAAAGAVTDGVYRSFVSGGSGDGIWIEAGAGAIAPISQNDLSGNTGFALRNDAAPSILAERNWWGSNVAASVAAEVSGTADFDPWLASGTDVSVAIGFQPFLYATTSGTLTTLLGTGGADISAVTAGDPVSFVMNGETAFTALAGLLNLDIQLAGGDDTLTLGATGVPTTLDMGSGTGDLLIGPNVAVSYNITSANGGTASPIASTFAGVENITAGTGADSFVFGAAGTLGTINGNTGVDTLDVSAVAGAVVNATGPGSLDGVQGTTAPLSGGFDNINLVNGSPADLIVSKTSVPATVNAGQSISYPMTVTNAGPNGALAVALSDTLPAGTTFTSLTAPAGWSCSTPAVGSGGTVSCSIPSLPLGGSPFTLVVTAPTTGGPITNTVTVTSANEGAPGNESASVVTTVNALVDLSVTKSGPASVNAGAAISWTINVSNAGPDAALGVTMNDPLPAGTTFTSLTAPAGWSCTTPAVGSGGTVNCTIASLAAGTASFTLVVTAPTTAGNVVNTATVSSTNESAAGNESGTATTAVGGLADLTIVKTGPVLLRQNSVATYTIAVTNNGPAAATNVVVTDVIPAGLSLQSATPSQGSCSGTTTVTCTLGSLADGASATITLQMLVTATSGTISNTATATATETDPTPANSSTARASVAEPIPTASSYGLLALAALLAALAIAKMRS